jgi:hypothetical protein
VAVVVVVPEELPAPALQAPEEQADLRCAEAAPVLTWVRLATLWSPLDLA